MKKQDIRNIYTQKVTELLNQGYTIFPDTMNGSQGEIAHIDLTNGSGFSLNAGFAGATSATASTAT